MLPRDLLDTAQVSWGVLTPLHKLLVKLWSLPLALIPLCHRHRTLGHTMSSGTDVMMRMAVMIHLTV
jgi:hypothetical protein